MRKERSYFEEKIRRTNSKDARELKNLYDWWYFRPQNETTEVEVPPDTSMYE